MGNNCIKSMLVSSILVFGLVFSGSAFSTLIKLSEDMIRDLGEKKMSVGGVETNYAEAVLSTDGTRYKGINKFSAADYDNLESAVLSFRYGLWADDGRLVEIHAELNNVELKIVTAKKGYSIPGFKDATFDYLPSLAESENQLVFHAIDTTVYSDHNADKYLDIEGNFVPAKGVIGQVYLNYELKSGSVSPAPKVGSVPTPGTLALMLIGVIGLSFARKKIV